MPNNVKDPITIKKGGRIVYVEPNDVTEIGVDNSYHNPEDLNFFVDVEIETVKRDACGSSTEDNTTYTMRWNKKDSKVSFFMGTKNSLTTEYLDIISSDIASDNPKISSEGIGIESINVDFNEWYYPTATIKFIDVRGISLMSPEQYASDNNKDSSPTSFFKAFFIYPYPKITLKIKGFYGQSVTFQMSISDFRTNFNSSNGNFETTVQLIGYMYGAFTDIDMSYLIASPYDKHYGEQYWNTAKFTLKDGENGEIPMPKLGDLLIEYFNGNIIEKKDKISGNNQYIQESRANDNILNLHTNVKNSYSNYIADLRSKGKWVGNDDNFVILTNSEKIYADIDLLKGLIEAIDKAGYQYGYPNIYTKTTVGNSELITEKIFEIENRKSTPIGENNPNSLFTKIMDILGGGVENSNIRTQLINSGYSNAILFSTDNFYSNLSDKIKTLVETKKVINDKVISEQSSISRQVLGFTPTIENVFKIVLAHMDTFLHSCYKAIDDVKNSNRKLRDFGMSVNSTDIKSISDNVFVPPFPLLTEKGLDNDVKPIWIDNNPKGFATPESALIKGLLSAITSIEIKKSAFIDNQKNIEDSFGELDFIPTLTSDVIYGKNPYNDLFLNNKSTIKADELLCVFILRSINFLYNNDYNTVDAGIFAQSEAYNFWKVKSTYLNDDFLSVIEKTLPQVVSFMNGNKTTFSVNGENIFKSGATNNFLIDKEGKFKLFVDGVDYNDRLPHKFDTIGNAIDINSLRYLSPKQLQEHSKPIDIDISRNYLEIFNGNDFGEKLRNTKNNIVNEFKGEKVPEIFNNLICGGWDIDVDNKDSNYISCYKNITMPSMVVMYKNNYGNQLAINQSLCKSKYFYGADCGVMESNTYNSSVGVAARSDVRTNGTQSLQKLINDVVIDSKYDGLNNAHNNLIYTLIGDDHETYSDSTNTYRGNKGETIFGYPFYYTQNTHSDDEIALLTKGLYFLMKMPFHKENINNKINTIINNRSGFISLPKTVVLYIGGELWRERYQKNNGGQDCFKTNNLTAECVMADIKNKWINSKIFNLSDRVKDIFISNFIEWGKSDNGFNRINDSYELTLKDGSVLTDSKLKAIVDKIKTIKEDVDKTKELITVFSFNVIENYDTIIDSVFGIQNTLSLRPREGTSAAKIIIDLLLTESVVSKIVRGTDLIYTPNPREIKNPNFGGNIMYMWSMFHQKLKETNIKINNSDNKIQAQANIEVEDKTVDDVKLPTYLNIKSLYDRWLCSNSEKIFRVEEIMKYFHFIDSFYEPIGNRLLVNFDTFMELLRDSNNLNVFNFMSTICKDNGVLFLTLPVYNNWDTDNIMRSFFQPISLHNMNQYDTHSSFVCMYMHEPSKNLNIDNNGYFYSDDGFFSSDVDNQIPQLSDNGLNNDKNIFNSIPAFAVSFGKQNQSYFKTINVGMDNPQATIESILATQDIANSEQSPIKPFVGQDLYKVFSSRSYTCDVTMMGCATLMPLMYFELRGIPMFSGTYMIIKVKHNIVQGSMETSFTGVRLSRYNTPLVTEVFSSKDLVNNLVDTSFISGGYLSTKNATTNDNISDLEYLGFKNKYVSQVASGIDFMSYTEMSKYVNFTISEKQFNGLERHMKELMLIIAKTLENYKKEYPHKLTISSAWRGTNTNSQHYKGEAFDIVTSRTEADAFLFDMICNTVLPHIDQLIWEFKGGDYIPNSIISNVLHISSKGISSNQNRKNIFQSYCTKNNGNTVTTTIRANNVSDDTFLKDISAAFNRTVGNLINKDLIKPLNILSYSNILGNPKLDVFLESVKNINKTLPQQNNYDGTILS